jgi:hypothetical protein
VPTGPDEHLSDEIVGTFYEIGLNAIADGFATPEHLPDTSTP